MQELHLVHKLSQKMTIGFRRPLGSNADVRELEYISVLCQTDMSGVRVDGSIQGACTSSLPSFCIDCFDRYNSNVQNGIVCQRKTLFTFCDLATALTLLLMMSGPRLLEG